MKKKMLILICCIVFLFSIILILKPNNDKSVDDVLEIDTKESLDLIKTDWNEVKDEFFTEITIPTGKIKGLTHIGVFKKTDDVTPLTFIKQDFEGEDLAFVNIYIEKTDITELPDIHDVSETKEINLNGIKAHLSTTESETTQQEKTTFYRIKWVNNNCTYHVIANNVELEILLDYLESLI